MKNIANLKLAKPQIPVRISSTIVFFVIACLISGCENINTPEAYTAYKLDGKWSSTYTTTHFLILFPPPEPDTLVTLIEFKKDSFFVIIGKHENIFPEIKNNSGISRYNGIYETEEDTLRLYFRGEEPFMEDFIFSARGDKMKLRTAPKAGPNGFSIISMSSLLWRDAFGKTNGTFERVRERKR